MRRVLADGRTAVQATAARALSTEGPKYRTDRLEHGEARRAAHGAMLSNDDVRATAAKRELAVLAEAFQRYDGDASGALDRYEIERALEDLKIPHDEVFVDDLFEALDQNKDGTVELREWLDHLPRGTRLKVAEKFSPGSALDEYRAIRFVVPTASIVYTYTDEAPMLATHSLLPIVRAFTESAGVQCELRDISLAGRVLANFPDKLDASQRVTDELTKLGELCKTPAANVIKLPNISASIPQLEECVAELREKGYDVPPYTDASDEVQKRYGKVLGSAVNPVLREGNSDRRVAKAVKEFAQQNPHSMGAWSSDSKSHVAHMDSDDFYGSEQSHVVPLDVKEASNHKDAGVVRIEFVGADGSVSVLKNKTPLQPGEVIDASKMDVAALREFYRREIDDAKAQGVLFSLHLKATMMKVSDPIMFGHCVEVFYRDTFAKHADFVREHGVDATLGLGDFYAKLEACGDDALKDQISQELEACLKSCDHVRPPLAMVDSDRGITNLHVPSDIIIDASMPAALRDSGKMWGPDNELADTKYVIPDRCYATSFKKVVEHLREHGQFDPSTMGAVSNVGLMAQKAQEYGSHDKTFEAPSAGSIRVVARDTDEVLMEHRVKEGDVWRMCQTKDSPIQDWVRLAVARARATGDPALFWLDKTRAHDANLIAKVETYLKDHDTSGLDLRILAPEDAMEETLQRSRKGLDTVSVTGNVLRDYLTDLFPILELGTSAKMLSIVPLLAGGGLFETGAGGSAPKHVQQLQQKNHLRWDSLGEFLALAVSIEDLAEKTANSKAKVVAEALNDGIGKLLTENKSPKRKPGMLDNRGSHFYLALYWADAMASQTRAPDLAARFAPAAALLAANEERILEELAVGSHAPADVGGYYKVDAAKADAVMRPSATLNAIVDSFRNNAGDE